MATGTPSVTAPRPPDGTSRPSDTDSTGALGSRAPAWTRYGAPALALLPLSLLVMAAWLGRHVRPGADEWCFLPQVRDHGIAGLIGKFYFQDNGRLGNGVLVGLYAKFGVAGHQWFGPVSAVVTLGVLWAVIVLVLRAAGRTAPRGIPLLVAAMATAVFLLATVNTYKTFYWPGSSVSHTLAPVLACAGAIPLLRVRSSRAARRTAAGIALATGVFMGTLSEETSVVALVVLAALLISGRALFTPEVRSYARVWCLTGAAGIVVGTVVLLTSPGSLGRRDRYGAQTASLFAPESLGGSLTGFLDILGTVLTSWSCPGAAAAGLLLGLLVRERGGRAPVLLPVGPGRLLLGGALTFLVAGYLCTLITFPLFGQGVSRASRTWNDYLLLYVLLLVGAGALLGRALRSRGWYAGASTVLGAAVCAAVCGGLAGPLGGLGQEMRVRAERWDRQDQRLREGAARGARVLPYQPLSVSGMGEPFGGKAHRAWPAKCVADYYRLEKITYAKQLP
ncbi:MULTISPECIES: DUF6056 family protein [unclassified Streptomyces]|uniref:DUF6056 family protein n=1 Tax=unclassified Streptomyces TaxID=2593676 RepID=UPI003818057C